MKATRVVAVLVVVALVAVAVFIATGGSVGLKGDDSTPGSGESPTLAPTPTPHPGSSEPPKADLASFYAQTLRWRQCRDEFECATLKVPLDYQDPGGDTFDLALLKDPADDLAHRVGSLVVNPGGPGAAGTAYAAAGSNAWGDALRADFDIVGFDPRGTGSSEPVDCLSDADLDAFLASDPDPDTPEEVAQLNQMNEQFGAGCLAKSGERAAHVSTIEAARDMDVLRSALGEATLLYFGASYGTKLGATYAEFFPDRVGRMVLDGAIDPTLDDQQSARSQAAGFETALRSYVQNCVDEGDCFLGDSVDEGVATIQGLLQDLDEQPIPTSDSDRRLTEGLAIYGIIAPLYVRDYWIYLDQGLQTALEGDGTILMFLADSYSRRDKHGTFTSNLLEAFRAINCLDDPSFTPAAEVPLLIPDMLAASPTFGRGAAWSLTGCAGFTTRSTEKVRPIRGKGAAPIMVIGTTRDPATPYEEAVALAEQLESGVLVSRDGDGHTAYLSGNECIDDAVESYLVDGTVPQDGLEC